ncbi:MAG: alpha/beta hydrolase [Candidatus Thiodiazotropha sp. (ex Ctena orbiculata)]|nr:alpha/beta hydrolase [Candidatus Thiodiazotropha taylori]
MGADKKVKLNETPFFFTCNTYRLYGVLHLPDQGNPAHGFVFCHPFVEEKLWAHKVYVSFARELVANGYAVMRFDHYGHGDSEGEFRDATISIYKQDIDAAINELKIKVPSIEKVSLFGFRLGATVAASISEDRDDIASLILWEPVVNGEAYIQELLRSHLATQLSVFGKVTVSRQELIDQIIAGEEVNIDGYELTKSLYDEIKLIDLSVEKKYKGNVFILQISSGLSDNPNNKYQELCEKYETCKAEIVVEKPFWREIKEFYRSAENLSNQSILFLRAK